MDEAKYDGKTLYQCPHCPFDTFDKKAAKDHDKNPTGPHVERHLKGVEKAKGSKRG